jgi:phenylacetate-coenzyme A ligase PaaK-like adenylate-forming protein
MHEEDFHKWFAVRTPEAFERGCMALFRWQAEQCAVYRTYLDLLGLHPSQVNSSHDIPFLPITFFKTHPVVSGTSGAAQTVFTSSGTTGSQPSQHHVHDMQLYDRSFSDGFTLFYGRPSEYTILALLPSYLERQGSSLVYMVEHLMRQSGRPGNGFFMHDFEALHRQLQRLQQGRQRVLLIGVTYALLDFAEQYPRDFPTLIVMETGGMKGKRDELPRDELHRRLCKGFGVRYIHSEYGMTELLSQAYSAGDGLFRTPPWMQVRIRDRYDPFAPAPDGATGGVNIIDLANVYSCAFIETQDAGKRHADGVFEITGRCEQSDLRGCNLMYE